MPCTLSEAHDQILALLHAASLGIVIQYPDMPSPPARPAQASWAQVLVEDSDDAGSNTLVGSDGSRRYETHGIITVAIYAMSGDGRREAQRLAELVLRAYRGRRTTGGVWFRRERVRDVGPDGTWYHVNVIIEYQYDTIEAPVTPVVPDDGFDPLTLGIAAAWFDAAEASDAGPGLAFTYPNQLTTDHATTIITARKPVLGTASNGVPILICNGSSCLQVPLYTGINGLRQWGIHFHIRMLSASGNPVPFSIDSAGSGGASARKLIAQRFGGDLGYCFASNTTGRSAGPASLWPLNTWVGCGLEINLDLAAEQDRMVWTIDGLPVTSTFAPIGGLGSLPATMPTPTGFMNLFAQGAVAGGNGIVAQIGRHTFVWGAAMAGVTSGLMTPAARLNINALDRPA